MSKFAAQTSVSSEKSRAEIEQILSRYGANRFMYGWHDESAVIAFEMSHRQIRFVLPLPSRNGKEFTHTPTGKVRKSQADVEKVYDQAVRQKWRALALVIKAKLEAVESGITIFEDEFMAHVVLPNGQTTGEWARPQIQSAYDTGKMPPLLPDYSSKP